MNQRELLLSAIPAGRPLPLAFPFLPAPDKIGQIAEPSLKGERQAFHEIFTYKTTEEGSMFEGASVNFLSCSADVTLGV